MTNSTEKKGTSGNSADALAFRVEQLEKQLASRPSYMSVLFIVIIFTLLNAVALLTISPQHVRGAFPWMKTAEKEMAPPPPLFGAPSPTGRMGEMPPPPPGAEPRGDRNRPDPNVLLDRLFNLMERAIEMEQRNPASNDSPTTN